MATYSDTVKDEYGRAVPGATIRVYGSDGETLVTTVTTDSLGAFTITEPDDVYKIVVQVGGIDRETEFILVGAGPDVPQDVLGALTPFLTQINASRDAAAASATAAQAAVISNVSLSRRVTVIEDEIRDPLPATGGTYHAVYSSTKLLPTSTRPFARGIRNSDSAAIDIPYTGRTVAPGDIKALRGTGAEVRLDIRYNQTGTGGGFGSDLTQTVAIHRPGIREDVFQDGAPVIFHDGGDNFIGGPGGRGWDLTLAATGQSCTMFFVTDFKASIQQQLLFACNGSSGVSGGRTIYRDVSNDVLGRGASILYLSPAGTSVWPYSQFPARPAVIAFREKAGAPVDMFMDGVISTAKSLTDMASPGSTPTSETLTNGVLCYTVGAGQTQRNPNMRMLAFVVVNGNLTDAEVISITRALQSNFGIPSKFDSRIVIIGDSIAEGGANTDTLELMWYLRQQSIKGVPDFYNLGLSGKTLTACYGDRLLYDLQSYKTGDPVVYVLQGGSNDLHNGVTAATLYALLTSYVSYLHGLGTNVKVVACTIMKRADFTGAMETQRAAYNALVAANAAGADAIWDPHAALAAVDPNYVTNNTILGDTTGTLIHPSSYGYSLLAPSLATALNTVLT